MKKSIFIILSCLFLFGCCDSKHSARKEYKEYQPQFEDGQIIKAKIDGRTGQVIQVMNNGDSSRTAYYIRFNSNEKAVRLYEYELEKNN